MAVELGVPQQPDIREARTPPAGPLTYEQFLDWADEDTLADGWTER
jgi:hypothetical protein